MIVPHNSNEILYVRYYTLKSNRIRQVVEMALASYHLRDSRCHMLRGRPL